MDNNCIISKNIKDLRVKYGYTQVFIAEYLNLTAAAVNQYENDARTIPTSVIEKLAILFDVEEYDLYEENPEKRQLISSFAFRAGELSAQDMQSVSKFKKVILNYLNMSSARANE
ncbi:MAG TPA: XRE family transcriptional regulator [Bacteroidales bacterium]|nr:XRE family transcriptional regulator [Bacteroidales bacterium]